MLNRRCRYYGAPVAPFPALKRQARLKSRYADGGRNFKKRSESERTVRSNEGIYDYEQTHK